MNEPAAVRRKFPPLSILGALVFFAILWQCDFPRPGYDDLFYNGAALNLAKGGDFSNPLLARQEFPSHYYFVYPPIQSYELGLWLKILGIGANQVLAFSALNYFIISAATILVLRRRNSPVWMEWAVPLAVAFAFLPFGLRPEAPAAALTLAGFVIGTWRLNLAPTVFAGFLLMFLGTACAPRVVYFDAAMILTAAWLVWKREGAKSATNWKLFAAMSAAFLLTILIFLWMIHFRAMEFWTTFNVHASRVAGRPFAMVKDYAMSTLGILQWPLALLPLGLMAQAIWRGKGETRMMAVFFAGGVLLTVLSGGVGIGTLWWAMFVMLTLAGPFVVSRPGKLATGLQLAMALSILVYGRKLMIENYGILSGNISLAPSDNLQAARQMRPEPGHPLVVDGAAARYVYDYRLPEGVFDLSFCAPFPGGFPGGMGKQDFRPGDIYMSGAHMTGSIAFRSHLDLSPPVWRVFNSPRYEYEKYPRQVYIFPSEECGEPRHRAGDSFWLPNGGASR